MLACRYSGEVHSQLESAVIVAWLPAAEQGRLLGLRCLLLQGMVMPGLADPCSAQGSVL